MKNISEMENMTKPHREKRRRPYASGEEKVPKMVQQKGTP